jgi:hypothetical protein
MAAWWPRLPREYLRERERERESERETGSKEERGFACV